MDGLTSTPSRRWLACLGFVLAGPAIVIRGIVGIVGVVGVTVASARRAAGLLRGRHATGLSVLPTKQVEISADVLQIPVGVDGDSILMPTPVTCAVFPGALRVWVPPDRMGVPAPKPPKDWARLRYLAGISETARACHRIDRR